MFVWATIIYNPIACWTWNASGWVYQMGGLDFAGGTPVHISSGAAALAYSLMLGKRRGYSDVGGLPYRPHNVTHVVLGTVFLWVGWFGFNGGSALAANLRAVSACMATNLAASVRTSRPLMPLSYFLSSCKTSMRHILQLSANPSVKMLTAKPSTGWRLHVGIHRLRT